jgi:hypothetical protein
VSTVRCWVKLNGEIVHDETCVNEHGEVSGVSYPGMTINGDKIEVGFDFDPPLLRPPAAEMQA